MQPLSRGNPALSTLFHVTNKGLQWKGRLRKGKVPKLILCVIIVLFNNINLQQTHSCKTKVEFLKRFKDQMAMQTSTDAWTVRVCLGRLP
jgi:hypothetical protein